MATFDLLPAIDLRGGRVVRLRQGDFGRETAYSDDPVSVAETFVDGGAQWLHVVDLDGARDGRPAHAEVIGRLIAAVGDRVAVEVAGGLRTSEAVAEVLEAGAARAVVGTAALRDRDFAADLVRRHGDDRIAVAIDVRDGMVVDQGWVAGSTGGPVSEAIEALVDGGVHWLEVTAVARDGTLEGPDLDLLTIAVMEPRACVIASGGISSTGDLLAVRRLGCAGAIVGRALYDGTLDLTAALAELAGA
jgi:phosphoribosylformimino-5-aminoimidazole carboxamide ribotide isomerase